MRLKSEGKNENPVGLLGFVGGGGAGVVMEKGWARLASAYQTHNWGEIRHLYHAIKNTASQNTGTPLDNQGYYVYTSLHAPRVCRIDCVGPAVIFNGMGLLLYHGISHWLLVFPWHTVNSSDSKDILQYTTRMGCITSIYQSWMLKLRLFHSEHTYHPMEGNGYEA